MSTVSRYQDTQGKREGNLNVFITMNCFPCQVFVEHESLEVSRRLQNEPIGLDTCLNAFIREEELGEDELYYCSKCKTHRLAAKKLELWSLPPILVRIH